MYNCEDQIEKVLNKFSGPISKYTSEILVIDNGSSDNSVSRCLIAMTKIQNIKTTLVKNNENYSLGGSHKVAFNYALENGFDYVGIIHGDDQGDVNDIVSLLENGEHHHFDCLLGARFMKSSTLVNYSWVRIFGNKVFNCIASLITKSRVFDLGAGLNFYKISFLKNRAYLRFPNALYFNYYLFYYTVKSRATFKYFPIVWREEGQPSNARLFNIGLNFLKLSYNYLLTRGKFIDEWNVQDRPYTYSVINQGASCD